MADIISGKSRFGNGNQMTYKKLNVNFDNSKAADDDENSAGNDDNSEESTFSSEELDQSVEKKIKQHRRNVAIAILAAIILTAVVIAVIVNVADGITYSSYAVTKSVNCDDSESTKYISYLDGYLKYSNDGVSYVNSKGVSVWNQTVSMQNPQIKTCGDAVAVGDINGSKIYVFNKSGALGTIDTSLAISQIEVAKQGVVAAVLEDNDANYINMYNVDGTKIYSVKTSLAGDGYPLDISISEDATKLMASYLYVSGESMKTNVVFYNFSDVGKNETERVVGGFNHYDSTIVGDVQFVNKTTAVAIGENVVSIYSIKEYPKLAKEIEISSEIERVIFSSSYIGLVLNNSDSGDIYRLVLYNFSGDKVCETTFNTQYDDIQIDGKSVVMHNSNGFTVMNFKGKILADIKVEMPLENVLTKGTRGSYVLVNSKYIQNIKLK